MILTALTRYYERLADKGAVPAYGFSRENISFAVVLDTAGNVTACADLRDTSGKKPRPGRMTVPQSFKRPGTTPRSFFLWDKSGFALGVTADKQATQGFKTSERQHDAFRALHEKRLADTEDPGLRAFLAFLEKWRPEHFADAPFHADPMYLDVNFVFRLEGEAEYLHEKREVARLWQDHLDQDADVAPCLVTGEQRPLARLHPAIKGVVGAQSSGASIVSFNLDAFESYGNSQGANAPVSRYAAFAYTTALNHLLNEPEMAHQRVRVGDTTAIFWAEAPEEDSASAAEVWGAAFFNPSGEGEIDKLSQAMAAVEKGRPLADVDPALDEQTRFYVLGLAPNASRLAIRFWYVGTLGGLAKHIRQHYADLALEPPAWKTPPGRAAWPTPSAPTTGAGTSSCGSSTGRASP